MPCTIAYVCLHAIEILYANYIDIVNAMYNSICLFACHWNSLCQLYRYCQCHVQWHMFVCMPLKFSMTMTWPPLWSYALPRLLYDVAVEGWSGTFNNTNTQSCTILRNIADMYWQYSHCMTQTHRDSHWFCTPCIEILLTCIDNTHIAWHKHTEIHIDFVHNV